MSKCMIFNFNKFEYLCISCTWYQEAKCVWSDPDESTQIIIIYIFHFIHEISHHENANGLKQLWIGNREIFPAVFETREGKWKDLSELMPTRELCRMLTCKLQAKFGTRVNIILASKPVNILSLFALQEECQGHLFGRQLNRPENEIKYSEFEAEKTL